MSAADKLAQVLTEHGLAGMAGGFGDQPDAKTHACRCDRRWVTAAEYAAHQAAAVLAHLTAEGWAQGREEFAVKDGDEVDEIEPPTREWAGRVAAANNAHLRRRGWAGENVVVRRRVTDWEPVEGEHHG